MLYKKQLRLALGLVLMLVLAWGSWRIYNSVMHRGKIAVQIQTVPSSARVTLNGKKISSSKTYLEPGEYVFSASEDGFETNSAEVPISASRQYVGLILSPISEEAKKWAVDNQTEYAEIGSRVSNDRVSIAEKDNPLLEKLPYYDIIGPFAIDFDFGSEGSLKAKTVIRNSTPNGRLKALKWIREQGVDPADLMIEFEDFDNPTSRGDV